MLKSSLVNEYLEFRISYAKVYDLLGELLFSIKRQFFSIFSFI
ncbi:conserved hypothetical protein (plasmid) [Borreliella valaisiana VS116]|uniref:Uncharacterized protein n=1 Tax=Borreliella valaisiana VS116 TaxID=445987 RepID=C0R8R9_BORVA|nr:conserved hypothetical protein [Borreliella valaisiana VS116]